MSDQSHEVNDVVPTSLAHLVGQRSVIEQVSIAVDAAFADNRRMDSGMLVGPPGVGKTALAQVVAKEMASGFHELLGQSVVSPADLNALLLVARDKDIVHIDEAHELRREFQTALYLALDQHRIILQTGVSRQCPQSIPINDFTLLLSTTDEHCLLPPLRDRMRLVLRFQFYSDQELTTILIHRCKGLGWELHEEILPLIAQRSRGTPRLALRLLQSCRRVCRAAGETTITADHLRRACSLETIDDLGLGPVEQHYLSLLADGPTRLNVLASMLGLPSKTVSDVVEPFLLRIGLTLKDEQGRRQLTAKAREHLSSCREKSV